VLGFEGKWAESLDGLEAPALSCYINLDLTVFVEFVHMFGCNAGQSEVWADSTILRIGLEPVLFLAGSKMVLILKVRKDGTRDRLKDSVQSCRVNLGIEVGGFLVWFLPNFRVMSYSENQV
jgi:hypothetical protein